MAINSNDFADDELDNDYAAEGESNVATLDDAPEEATSAEWTGPCCDKCRTPLGMGVVTICRNCGWYASLNTFVEVDREWETALEPKKSAMQTETKSHTQVWLELVPRWGWVIVGSVFFVILESVVARLVTPAESSLRTIWSLTQLAIGLATAAGCHAFNFLSLAADDADVGLLDLVLRPLRLWTRTCQRLPKRLWFFNALLCSLTAAVMSPLVIGGIPYERFWDWGFKEPVKQDLMGAVMDRVKKLDEQGSDNLEDAIGDFAGKGGVEGDELPKAEPEKPKDKTDCVVLGYQLDRDGRLETLLLGTAHRSKLAYAGRVTPKLSEQELSDLVAALKPLTIREPIISIPAEHVVWVKPKFTCRVTFAEQKKDGSLREIGWDTMLGSMSVSGKK